MALIAALLAILPPALDPIEFGKRELSATLGRDSARVDLVRQPKLGKESYRIVGDGKRLKVEGGDASGLMYGAMEVAERFRNSPSPRMNRVAGRGLGGGESNSPSPAGRGGRGVRESLWNTKAYGKPYLADRGLNLFLTLPWDYKQNDTDYSLEALTDPDRWWFHNEDYWSTLLDLMARSRLNWLDIHGAWDISVTNAPNLYAYFVTSASFPKVGVSEAIKHKNLAQLNHIIEMAHARGIRVSLMAYEANLRIPQNPNPGYEASEANIYTYTKEVVEQMIRRAPKLDALGYRIGESGKGEAFFHCYGEAVKASGRDIPLITRSWITRRQNVLPLARASKDYTVQIKYNGEQWGAPYMIAGGRMANWYSYSFEDYLSDSSGVPGSPSLPESATVGRGSGGGVSVAKLWPGNLISPSPRMDRVAGRGVGGGETRWPSNPYKIVWQVRANGTHRIFPFYNPEMVRSTIKTMKIGTATGYTIEGLDAYYPKSPDYYLANPADKYCDWIHQRDEMYWMTWGRLGYDPGVKDEVFERHMEQWFGTQAKTVAFEWAAACRSLMLAFSNYSLGPDHRNHAPELETGGDNFAWMEGKPFDTSAFLPIQEEAAYRSLGVSDGRMSPSLFPRGQQPYRILGRPENWHDFASDPRIDGKRVLELNRTLWMLGALERHYQDHFLIARSLAANDTSAGFAYPHYDPSIGIWGWERLSRSDTAKSYKPFTERLRMRTNTFHWANLWDEVRGQQDALLKLPDGQVAGNPPFFFGGGDYEMSLKCSPRNVEASVPARGLKGAWLLVKLLPSSTFFHRIPMQRSGSSFVAQIPRPRCGLACGAELESLDGTKARIPQWPSAPYDIVPALPGPTPQVYSTEEAMTYLDPAVLKTQKYAAMLIAPRAWRFHNGFDNATKRKILDPVERGMTLVVMQQDYVSGRYKMDWLPVPLKVENNPQPTVFDPGGAMGLKRIETSDILWQRFVAPPPDPLPTVADSGREGEWKVFGNGGVAHLKWGKGHIWMVNARLMQRMTHPDCARALNTLMEFCAGRSRTGSPLTPQPPLPDGHKASLGDGEQRPVVIIDPGTEDAAYSTSFFPDFMNVLDIPFLTLGEVIAKEQGLNSFTPIPGKIEDDDILQGNGERMVNAFLRNQVVQASKRPTPSNLADFEKERTRRRAELMRCLGLDPMPPTTPLNARITGVIQRKGYRIEKVVFESRPKFYVTAHVYVPEGRDGLYEGDALYGLRQRGPSNPSNPSKFPVIVHVNGHWAHKKSEDRLQLRAAFCALQGYIAIVVDSPGWSFEGNSLIERRAEGNHSDWFLFHGGTNATGYYVWDCIRALDYMETRPDADMNRIGITGASGGGLATLYTFAADDRYKAAVPVVYMASMELAPDNGCLCNHVPGTSQIGDRSDVIAIQAPKPVLIMGAKDDPEFPPAATLLTVEKMKKTWKLFDRTDKTDRSDSEIVGRIFEGPHDYNQLMREQMIGFFNRHLKGEGDGSPVPQPPIEILDPEDRQVLVLDPSPTDERTMRDLSTDYLAHGVDGDGIALNGGKPKSGDLNWKETVISPTKRIVTFESEPGFVTPGVLILPPQAPSGATIHVHDEGKVPAMRGKTVDGRADLYLDLLGIGELGKLEMRYLVYLGTSVAFKGGWQLIRAAEAMKKYGHVRIDAQGPLASQAAWWATKLDPSAFEYVSKRDPIRTWDDALKPGMSPYLVQPRAHLMKLD